MEDGSESRAVRFDIVGVTPSIGPTCDELRREEPERAAELWQALVSGRRSIVESVEGHGKRYLLARRNAPGVACPRTLTECERAVLALAAAGHSNNAVCHELGLSAARV